MRCCGSHVRIARPRSKMSFRGDALASNPESITTPRVRLAAFAETKKGGALGYFFALREWPKGQTRQ